MKVSIQEFTAQIEAINTLYCLRQRTTHLEPKALAKQCERDVYGVYHNLVNDCTGLEARTVRAVITKCLKDSRND